MNHLPATIYKTQDFQAIRKGSLHPPMRSQYKKMKIPICISPKLEQQYIEAKCCNQQSGESRLHHVLWSRLFRFCNKKIILIMEMSYLNPYYPFLNASNNPYYYYMPPYPFEHFQVEPSSIPPKPQPSIKIEESALKKQKSAAKILARIKKLIKQLHRDDILNRKTHWSAEQDQLLRKLVQEEKIQWKAIPHHFKERTQNMCYSRYRRLQSERKQKKWTRVQEEQLISFVQKHGEKWKKISEELTNFTPKQIRERYLNYLRPNIDRSDFSIEEDFKICKFVIEMGKHWRKLEESLPGRPEGTIKSRFYAKLQDIIQTAHQDDD